MRNYTSYEIGFTILLSVLVLTGLGGVSSPVQAQPDLAGDPVDVSEDFQKTEQTYFVGSQVTDFDPSTGEGRLQWTRHRREPSLSFNKLDLPYARAESNEFPATEYDRDPTLPFSISFVSPRTVRLQFASRDRELGDRSSLMLDGPVSSSDAWTVERADSVVTYTSEHGTVRLIKDPWHIEFYDGEGNLLTRTQTIGDSNTLASPTPFSFVRKAEDFSRSFAASFKLSYDEKLFGGGESFTRLNKRGQKMNLSLRDGMGAQTSFMYKPIPFFLSSEGYGMFNHTSAPVTFDFGHDFDGRSTIFSGDDTLDLFVFLGEPKDVLSEYTAVTGRSPVPPLWSFGFWMSRITYESEDQLRTVADQLREHEIPSDVLHLDTGWFETEWRNNYKFAPSRFDDPEQMMSDLRDQGFHLSLWQLPYFTTKNDLFDTIVENDYAVTNRSGDQPFLSAILDFSDPDAVAWYEDKLTGLLEQGVSVIKADFGENAPWHGIYDSGRTGYYEHNLYPLRYNKIVSDLTEEITGDRIIWGRSAWAGSQRYPVHWSGDAGNSNSAMAATLRSGLSFGLSGFTYWSHDVGGFPNAPSKDLYRRWLGFGAFTSHIRAHGQPPREPWEYGEDFTDMYRETLEARYRLMPYIYAQAQHASEQGHPMLRALFFEYPDDPTAWTIDDQFMLGSDLLVAPLLESSDTREVYLPPGPWIDYQTGEVYEGRQWHDLTAGELPVIVLVKNDTALPHIELAQNTQEMDWSEIELRVYSTDGDAASTSVALPEGDLHSLTLEPDAQGQYSLREDPMDVEVSWDVTRVELVE
jgi:alpha-D-xyloside xylohydrolase